MRALKHLAVRMRLAKKPGAYAEVTRRGLDDQSRRIDVIEQKTNGILIGLIVVMIVNSVLHWWL